MHALENKRPRPKGRDREEDPTQESLKSVSLKNLEERLEFDIAYLGGGIGE